RLLGGLAARGVGEDPVLLPVDDVEDRLLSRVVEVEPAEGDGDQLAARCLERGQHVLVRSVLAGAEEEAGAELHAGDDERVAGFDSRHGLSLVEAFDQGRPSPQPSPRRGEGITRLLGRRTLLSLALPPEGGGDNASSWPKDAPL